MSARSRWSLFWWIVFLVASLLMIIHNPSSTVTPLRQYLQDGVALFATPLTNAIQLIELWRHHRRIKEALVRSHLDNARLAHLEEENRRLRAMLELKNESSLHLIPADVVGQTSDTRVVGLIVARGFLHGVKPSAAVLNEKGLVGRVWRVSEASAIIQTIADPQLGIPSQLSNSGAQGIVRWKGLGRMRLEGIPSTVKVSPGDSVVTSSAGGIFPPQILIGRVAEVKPDEEGWLWDIEIYPSVNFPFIGEVFIVGRDTG